jgi:hypothetical protein
MRDAGKPPPHSGPSAKAYLDVPMLAGAGVAVERMSCEGYPQYPQLHGPFEPAAVSVLDLFFNVAPDAPQYLRALRRPS